MERTWQKNRQKTTSDIGCVGLYLNRNYDMFYNIVEHQSECDEYYAGNESFQSAEIRAVEHFWNSNIDGQYKQAKA